METCPTFQTETILSEGASRVKPEATGPLSSSLRLFWLLLEIQDHGIILYDPHGVQAHKREAVRQQMRALGTKKVMGSKTREGVNYGNPQKAHYWSHF